MFSSLSWNCILALNQLMLYLNIFLQFLGCKSYLLDRLPNCLLFKHLQRLGWSYEKDLTKSRRFPLSFKLNWIRLDHFLVRLVLSNKLNGAWCLLINPQIKTVSNIVNKLWSTNLYWWLVNRIIMFSYWCVGSPILLEITTCQPSNYQFDETFLI